MCGICGYVVNHAIDSSVLCNMNNSLAHRGPNDTGLYYDEYNGRYLGLGHRRLSILDLSIDGHQPMISDENSIILVFNGEIYNYKQLKTEILMFNPNINFNSNTDTEVLLKGWMIYGVNVINKLNGMFSFCIYDLSKRKMYLVRDRMGQKPLYYYKDDILVFASEIKAIKCMPDIELEINKQEVSNYMYYGYIDSPNTIYNNIYKLPQGSYLEYDLCSNDYEIKQYWNYPYVKEEKRLKVSENEAAMRLEKLLYDSIEKRLVADVPVGTFLSGGIDSSIISCIAQRIKVEPIDTFTISFDNKKYDESSFAKEVADIIGSNHHEIKVNQEDFNFLLEEMVDYFDEPFADPSEIVTMLVSEYAKKTVSVVLSGDGGDELFGGYEIYDSVAKYQNNLAVIEIIKKYGKSKYLPKKIRNINRWANMGANVIDAWNFERDNLVNMVVDSEIRPQPRSISHDLKEKDLVERRMHLDAVKYLPDDILVKIDRASMRCSLEARSPFMDHHIVEYAASLPIDYKYVHNNKKKILKKILSKYVPQKIIERPKMGFAVPIKDFLRSETQKEKLRKYIDAEFLKIQGLFSMNIRILIERFLQGEDLFQYEMDVVWNYYVFQLWYERWEL